MNERKNVLAGFISTAPDFQYSINLEYDFNSDTKIKNYILTTSAMEIIEDVLLSYSAFSDKTSRAQILIGPYGKGKSHLVLVTASLLYRRDIEIFDSILDTMKEYKVELYELAKSILNKSDRLLPVIISANSLSISQNLMLGLRKALIREGLDDIMPDTYFDAAIKMINLWAEEYKDTYEKLKNELNIPINQFVKKLKEYDKASYEQFTSIYPKLTSGSQFNPAQNEDVLDQYKSAIDKIRTLGYDGIFIIYDEFSKFLEASVDVNSAMEIKLLQDIAEYCNRSGENQLHIMLTSHKDIDNYIDKLPKKKVDAWKAVNERFKHVSIDNLDSQTYEIMSKAIIKKTEEWNKFKEENKSKFEDLAKIASRSRLFNEVGNKIETKVVYGCYPLQPITTYVLPTISERIAQNERTLFTFLSTSDRNSMGYFVKNAEGDMPLLTAAHVFDYFEGLFKKENYNSNIYKIWRETVKALKSLKKVEKVIEDVELAVKIIKVLGIIYILDELEAFKPIIDSIKYSLYGCVEDDKDIDSIIQVLINNRVLHHMKSNGFLKFVEATDVNVEEEILNATERRKTIFDIKKVLREYSKDYYVYPVRYNDENEIVRYFDFDFILSNELLSVKDWNKKITDIKGDGIIYAVLIEDEESLDEIKDKISNINNNRIVFILPYKAVALSDDLRQYDAITYLIGENKYNDFDFILHEELSVYLEDIKNIIDNKLKTFTAPELNLADYYNKGEKVIISRKTALSNLLSDICEDMYPDMPVIVNEMINKNQLTSQINTARRKVLQGMMKTKIEYRLGILGSGPDYSIMRSTLLVPGIYVEDNDNKTAYLTTEGLPVEFANIVNIIRQFIIESNRQKLSFSELYENLTKPEYGIGIKLGVVPIYIAVVLREYKEHTVITHRNIEMEITGQLLEDINESPSEYEIYCETWNEEKERYVSQMEELFLKYVDESEKEFNTFEYIAKAVYRWFLQLPKYAKEFTKDYVKTFNEEGLVEDFKPEIIDKEIDRFRNSLRGARINPRDFLFSKLHKMFGVDNHEKVIDSLRECVVCLDNVKIDLIEGFLSSYLKKLFSPYAKEEVSLTSSVKDWYKGLKDSTKNNVFADARDDLLKKARILGNDNVGLVETLARIFTGLRIDDWNDGTVELFMSNIQFAVNSINDFDKSSGIDTQSSSKETYKIKYSDERGKEVEMTFIEQEIEGFGQNLLNDIETLFFEDYRDAVTNSQKIAILLQILKKYC